LEEWNAQSVFAGVPRGRTIVAVAGALRPDACDELLPHAEATQASTTMPTTNRALTAQ